MFYISIYLINDGKAPISDNYSCYSDIHSIINLSHDNLNYSIDLREFKTIQDLPSTCNSNIVLITRTNVLFRPTIFNTVYSLANLFDDYGILCGPTEVRITNNHLKLDKNIFSIYRYNLNFGGSKINDITGETYNYPQLIGSFISGDAYNKCGYRITQSSRHSSVENKYFTHMLCQKYKIYHSTHLSKLLDINCDKKVIAKIYNDYYDSGYQDGRLLLMLDEDNKNKELWQRFIESPEALDNNIPRWALDKQYIDSVNSLETLILLKCKYQIGFYEGMTNQNII